jgi:hypothetical protein
MNNRQSPFYAAASLFVFSCAIATPSSRDVAIFPEKRAVGDGDAGTFSPSDYPCECQSVLGPYPWASPISAFHTEQLGPDGWSLPPCAQGDMDCMLAHATPRHCSSDADCQPDTVKGCRHAGCDQGCGICVFQSYPACMVDTCTLPGHHSTCASAAECLDAPYYNVDCIDGRCLILPDSTSGFYCAAPGDLRQIPDGGAQ